MKFKRKNYLHNYKLRIRTFKQTYSLLSLEDFFIPTQASIHRSPSRGSSGRSRPVTEIVTRVNLWNLPQCDHGRCEGIPSPYPL